MRHYPSSRTCGPSVPAEASRHRWDTLTAQGPGSLPPAPAARPRQPRRPAQPLRAPRPPHTRPPLSGRAPPAAPCPPEPPQRGDGGAAGGWRGPLTMMAAGGQAASTKRKGRCASARHKAAGPGQGAELHRGCSAQRRSRGEAAGAAGGLRLGSGRGRGASGQVPQRVQSLPGCARSSLGGSLGTGSLPASLRRPHGRPGVGRCSMLGAGLRAVLRACRRPAGPRRHRHHGEGAVPRERRRQEDVRGAEGARPGPGAVGSGTGVGVEEEEEVVSVSPGSHSAPCPPCQKPHLLWDEVPRGDAAASAHPGGQQEPVQPGQPPRPAAVRRARPPHGESSPSSLKKRPLRRVAQNC